MNNVVVTYPQNSQASNLLSTQEFARHDDVGFSTPDWFCWGERIRTSDWLIQNSPSVEIGQNLVFGAAGRSSR